MAFLRICSFLLLASGCSESHDGDPRPGDGGVGDRSCDIVTGPLRGTFDGRPWTFAWGQEWPLGTGHELILFGSDVPEPATCWPTPPRDRIYVQRNDVGRDARVLFLVAGDLSIEHEATVQRVELLEAPIDRRRLAICARDDVEGLFEVSGEIDVATCHP